MTGIKIVNLNTLVDEMGEETAKKILSRFSCPLNADVENFLKIKAIEFAKQGLSQTHIVMMSYKEEMVIVGYFTLAYKNITISSKKISSNIRRRVAKFATYDNRLKTYCLSAPLIAQLGKNYTNGYNKLIAGEILLELACNMIKGVQFNVGGRFAYLECEEKPSLIQFYMDNGFEEFDRRRIERNEADLEGTKLIQMIKYIKA
jgi:hypothetical protein